MKELLDLTVAAHGGLERWNSYRTVALELSVGGALWSLKGHAGFFTNVTYEADLQKQRATLGGFGPPDRRPLHAGQAHASSRLRASRRTTWAADRRRLSGTSIWNGRTAGTRRSALPRVLRGTLRHPVVPTPQQSAANLADST
jgi:hypothetical protein